VTEDSRKVHNEELHNFFANRNYNNEGKEVKIGAAYSTNGDKRNACRIIV
jgi:hypothetical protein